jgi:hypothetical protein
MMRKNWDRFGVDAEAARVCMFAARQSGVWFAEGGESARDSLSFRNGEEFFRCGTQERLQ